MLGQWDAVSTEKERRYGIVSIGSKIEEFVLLDAIHDPRYFANILVVDRGWILYPFC